MLDGDLEDSEEQHQTALRSHLLMVDRLIDLHTAKLRSVEKEFEKDLAELEHEFGAEGEEMATTHARNVREVSYT
eukprot:scaffold34429_cov108-Isochrysis_galbana.AAC.3